MHHQYILIYLFECLIKQIAQHKMKSTKEKTTTDLNNGQNDDYDRTKATETNPAVVRRGATSTGMNI